MAGETDKTNDELGKSINETGKSIEEAVGESGLTNQYELAEFLRIDNRADFNYKAY